ncbi:MAG: hypothetical protein PVF52_04870 [Granulosicoccaceae bacterium]|jgi:hypothetical protein
MGCTQEQIRAAQDLLASLQDFANRQSNAVLEVLQGQAPGQQQHYPPDGPVVFGNGQWRAFYHCHASPDTLSTEHGHFHIFTCCGDGDWRHVAGLSMDRQGQPLCWFAVNRWVSGGEWLEQEGVQQALRQLQTEAGAGPVATWLNAMLRCYTVSLQTLFAERDADLSRIMAETTREDVFRKREVYFLAQQAISLASDIHTCLQNKQCQ